MAASPAAVRSISPVLAPVPSRMDKLLSVTYSAYSYFSSSVPEKPSGRLNFVPPMYSAASSLPSEVGTSAEISA